MAGRLLHPSYFMLDSLSSILVRYLSYIHKFFSLLPNKFSSRRLIRSLLSSPSLTILFCDIDSMAEVLGVVASGIAVGQIAGQITGSIIKLKGYWSQIKEAPAEISHLFREIESFTVMLQHMQDDRSQQSNLPSSIHNICIQRSLDLCQECATELAGLVHDLAIKVQGKNGWRKKVGSTKVVLRKEDIKILKRRLKTAMGMLSLSYQFHTSAMIQLQPDIIMTRIANHLTTSQVLKPSVRGEQPQENSTEETCYSGSRNLVATQYDSWTNSVPWMNIVLGHFQYYHRQHMRRGKWQETIYATYRLPQLLSYYQFALWAIHPLSGWWFRFDVHRSVPQNNPFFLAIKGGDLAVV
ncbi:uncharacterized protein LY89DRAFT_97080 [Mollisia scopiformis]|uniref:Fungal N-terminal domain-containing protein n=1 Tax=Mollisia scopiformis TaxID=149040 RepID=A0A194X6L4_MOLSC|nr:uncharacterized protein LY89DRAFT_97080 [Mollisia scopiformis]KUJ15826.1 hypothetical protein LY89DRAFT_97080 [Mollisia scopiformis]